MKLNQALIFVSLLSCFNALATHNEGFEDVVFVCSATTQEPTQVLQPAQAMDAAPEVDVTPASETLEAPALVNSLTTKDPSEQQLPQKIIMCDASTQCQSTPCWSQRICTFIAKNRVRAALIAVTGVAIAGAAYYYRTLPNFAEISPEIYDFINEVDLIECTGAEFV